MSVDMIPYTAETVAVQRPAFWSIADDLEAYAETLAMIDAQLETTKDVAEFDALTLERIEVQEHIERLAEALVKKTDDLAGVLRRMKSDIGEQKAEEKRIHARRKASEAALSHLEGYTSSVMNKHGWRHLKTARNTVALRGNGGVQPLQITPELVPDELCTWSGVLTDRQYSLIVKALWNFGEADCVRGSFIRTPSNSLIREALIQPCADCDGTGKDYDTSECDEHTGSREIACAACGGSGKNAVPGCSLAPRGDRLEIR